MIFFLVKTVKNWLNSQQNAALLLFLTPQNSLFHILFPNFLNLYGFFLFVLFFYLFFLLEIKIKSFTFVVYFGYFSAFSNSILLCIGLAEHINKAI